MPVRAALLVVMALFALRANAGVPIVPTYRFDGWLHVSGTNLYDSSNHPVRLLSVNQSGAEYGAGFPYVNATNPAQFGGYQFPSYIEYTHLSNWGFNSIRLLVSWANMETNPPSVTNRTVIHSYNSDYLTLVDNTVSNFASHNLSVILSLHQHSFSPVFTNSDYAGHGLGMPVWLYYDTTNSDYFSLGGYPLSDSDSSRLVAEKYFFGEPPTGHPAGIYPVICSNCPSQSATSLGFTNPGYNVQDGYIDAWTFLAARYSNNPAVIGADLFNEPPNDKNLHLSNFYALLSSNIYAANSNLLLICQDSGSQSTNLVGLLNTRTSPPAVSNLVYSIHIYVGQWSNAANSVSGSFVTNYGAYAFLTNYQAPSLRWNVPFWVGEFDEFDTNGTFNTADMGLMMQYCRANGIGWSYFAYDSARKPLINNSTISTNLIELLQTGFDSPLNELSIRQAGSQVSLTWPVPGQGPEYLLQWSPRLNPAVWSNVPSPTTISNFENWISTDATNQAGFFRLWQQ